MAPRPGTLFANPMVGIRESVREDIHHRNDGSSGVLGTNRARGGLPLVSARDRQMAKLLKAKTRAQKAADMTKAQKRAAAAKAKAARTPLRKRLQQSAPRRFLVG